jgi:hypothetical protein
VVNGDEAQTFQAVALLSVVYDVAQTIQFAAVCQFFFRLADGSGYSEAESGPLVNLNFHLLLF